MAQRSTLTTRVSRVPAHTLCCSVGPAAGLAHAAFAQSLIPDDVKHETLGRVIKQGQAVHLDVELALVNVQSPTRTSLGYRSGA